MFDKRTLLVIGLVLVGNVGVFFLLQKAFLTEELVHHGTFPDAVGLEVESELDGTSTVRYQGRSVRVPSDEVLTCDLYLEARGDFASQLVDGFPTTTGWHHVWRFQIALLLVSAIVLYRWRTLPRV